jgi:hypothetical protein
MLKPAALLAAVVVGSILCTTTQASVGPQPPLSDALPTDLTATGAFSDPRLEVGGEIGVIVPHRAAPAFASIPHLSLKAPALPRTTVYADFAVGSDLLTSHQERSNAVTWVVPASTHLAAQSAFIRTEVVGPGFLDALAERFDINDDERPWSTTTTVHMLSSTTDFVAPFATLAYEEDSLEEYQRFGLGGGLQLNLDTHTTFGAEAFYFGDRLNDTMSRETRFLAKFEIDF